VTRCTQPGQAGKRLSELERKVYYGTHAQGLIVSRTPGEDELYD
jgi:hypothetical protein